ncbi:hypothetical protein D3C80_1606410 [compost metagenome]
MLRQTEQGFAFTREGVGHAGDPAFGADGDAFQHHVIQPGEQHKAIAHFIAQIDKATGVARGILEADDIFAIDQ